MVYSVNIITTEEAVKFYESCRTQPYFTSKADIYGVCIKLVTKDRTNLEMWNDNFHLMSDSVRSHGMIITAENPERGNEVDYDPVTSTAILYNFDYYGWIKSIALAIVTDILEDSHGIYAVHGAALDIDGHGVCIIAPSKTGKTTQSWGLLRMPNSHLITDDWFFVRLTEGRPRIHSSEKNCYIDADIGDVWEEYTPLVTTTKFDNKGRGIANVRWIKGQDSMVDNSSVKDVILLKRDANDDRIIINLTPEEALEYLCDYDFCNPHQMIRDERKISLRKEFYGKFLSGCRIHMINTVLSAQETQEKIRSVIGAE